MEEKKNPLLKKELLERDLKLHLEKQDKLLQRTHALGIDVSRSSGEGGVRHKLEANWLKKAQEEWCAFF